MKPQYITQMGTVSSTDAFNGQFFTSKRAVAFLGGLGMMALLFLSAPFAEAQSSAIRFELSQLRVTVPVNSTNTTVITNFVNLINGTTNASFDVNISGLPAGVGVGVGVNLTDTNLNPLLSTTQDTNLWITVNTTNLPQGTYVFNLNAGGTDTNGLPVTNSIPFVLQAAHIWYGSGLLTNSFDVSNNWANASSWLGGIPTNGDDVVFADFGAQTNLDQTVTAFTNIGISTNITVGSIRFAQSVYFVQDIATNALSHTIQIATNTTLSITGTNGFSLLRDYINDKDPNDRDMVVNVIGTKATMLVSNANANFAFLVGNGGAIKPVLNLSNLSTLVVNVGRMGLGEYQLYPNYWAVNSALNAGRTTNNLTDFPRRFLAYVYLAQTNFITAGYKDPDNYNNMFSRGYALSLQDSEQAGVGSSTPSFLYLGATNRFLLDSVCFGGANHAPTVRFGFTNGSAVFRATNGTGRLSVFTVSDDGGTNEASSNVKSVVDFWSNNGFVDVLADRLYISRDRTLISSNQTPNVQGDLTIGRGIVDVNTAILGYQEHTKPDWNVIYGTTDPYNNYCQGRLVVTNGGLFRVNGTLTLGYTADINDSAHAQQYNTYGQVTIYSSSTVIASNIVVDGGLNYYDGNGRNNNITINSGGTLVVSNTIGSPNPGAFDGSAAGNASGILLDNLKLTSGTLTLFSGAGKTNVFVRNLACSGSTPSIIKLASLTGLTSSSAFPATIPLISYQSATPFFAADMSGVTISGVANLQGYILNDTANKLITLFVTTNASKALVWTGSVDNNWDTTTKNWVPVGGGVATSFALGDIVTFNDTSTVTNINITEVIVANQSTNGVTITNSVRNYIFNPVGFGALAGTAKLIKQGTNLLTFNASEAGPILIMEGSVNGSGTFGTTTVFSNAVLNLDSSANITAGLISTGTVFIANGATVAGPLNIAGGVFVNSGFVNTTVASGAVVISGALATNTASGEIDVDTGANNGNWVVANATLANFGYIKAVRGRLNLNSGAAYFGTGIYQDSDSGLTTGNDGRFAINFGAVVSPGLTPGGDVGTMNVGARVDVNNTPGSGLGVLRIDVDFANPQTNDIVQADTWNNITGMILLTNINPSAGSFGPGQVFQIFQNNSGPTVRNFIDVNGTLPVISPTVPAPGLQWAVSDFRYFGRLAVTNCSLVWDGNGDGIWNTNGSANNWKSGKVFADNQGAMFDDSAAGTTTVNLTNTVAPMGFATTTVTNIIVGVSTNVVIITNNATMSPGLVVSNSVSKPYVFTGTGKVSGLTSLYKLGAGTLTILTTNDFNGSTYIDGGTIAFSNAAALGIAGSGGFNSEIFINGGTLTYMGLANVNFGRAPVLNPNGATVQVVSSTNEFTLNTGITGPGALTKMGPGVLVLNNNADVYSGGTIVNEGPLRLSAAAAGSGPITLNSGTTLQLTNNFTFTNAMNVAGAGVTIRVLGVSTNISSGAWSGGGTVTFSNINPFVFNGSLTNFSGTISFGATSASYRFNNSTNSNPCTGSALATFDLGSGSSTLSNLNGAALTYNLGGLAGGSGTVLSGRLANNLLATNGATTYNIGANGNNTVFSGKIVDGPDYTSAGGTPSPVTVVKVGSGSLLLNGANTYTGGTTVSNGILGGTGSIVGALTVVSGATLAPGATIGTFTVGGTATLAGAVVLELNRTNSPATNDMLVVTGTITATGTLVVTNVGPILMNGSKFQLFNKAVSGWSSKTLPANYTWTDNIGTDGSITLTSGGANPVNPNPTNIIFSVSGNALTLSWPTDHIGWQLWSNSVGLLNTDMWFQIAGSAATNQMIFTLDPAKTNVFFRLLLP
jgi:autotransporter-associated beta strand protein